MSWWLEVECGHVEAMFPIKMARLVERKHSEHSIVGTNLRLGVSFPAQKMGWEANALGQPDRKIPLFLT